MTIKHLLAAASGRAAGEAAIETAAKFDGENDYLTRGGGLTGAADSKQLIVSFWCREDFITGVGADHIILGSDAAGKNEIQSEYRGGFRFFFHNAAGTAIFQETNGKPIPVTNAPSAKWHHVLIACDLATTTGYFYIDDVSYSIGTVTNDTIDFTKTDWFVGARTGPGSWAGMGIQHFYFAPGQYLDISNATNRRKFSEFDANGQLVPVSLGSDGSTPTGTAPIIYLPFTDIATAGTNKGSGGNFTVNGTLELASTSPAVPSVDAVKYTNAGGDYLSKSSLTIADSKSGLFSAWVRFTPVGSNQTIISNTGDAFNVKRLSTGEIQIKAENSVGTTILLAKTSAANFDINAWRHVLCSWDLNTTTAQIYIDDVSDLAGGPTITNDTIDFTVTNYYIGATSAGSNQLDGSIAELFFEAGTYLDLSTESNRRKFINADGTPANTRQLDTVAGLSPHVYLPNPAATVGTNAGSGGDFTINGTPVDATSTPLYYYAEPALFDGTNDYLSKSSVTYSGKTKVTISFWVKISSFTALPGIYRETGPNSGLAFYFGTDGKLGCRISAGTSNNNISWVVFDTAVTAGQWTHIMLSYDYASGSNNWQTYVNNTSTTRDETNKDLNQASSFGLTSGTQYLGSYDGGQKLDGEIAEFFLDVDNAVDLSQESNRAKFIDATTLRPAGNLIETTGLTPMHYFSNEYSSFETNLGSGGDFTVTGALARGINSPSDAKAA